jgi:hypothetical protein
MATVLSSPARLVGGWGWGEMDGLTAVATRAARISGQLCPHPPVPPRTCAHSSVLLSGRAKLIVRGR